MDKNLHENKNLTNYEMQLVKAKKVVSKLEKLEIDFYTELIKLNILKRNTNIDIYKKIINEI
ncbi:conserved Plasmodium protein, unknown function [Plasmodium gallinaceum]|uniref:Uncharacterized protein n=1 Tax=Plasmodium gallinaceum TaxID=5849 RepID=A0A1J1GP83_PLAGA|nr:conserved Plasmodium protein, unknown function [Plasmodium gallinaceum]CRG94110.1 conserved Plasmodium protein, unknown function [Plasmodium gallinaceum]